MKVRRDGLEMRNCSSGVSAALCLIWRREWVCGSARFRVRSRVERSEVFSCYRAE